MSVEGGSLNVLDAIDVISVSFFVKHSTLCGICYMLFEGGSFNQSVPYSMLNVSPGSIKRNAAFASTEIRCEN